MAGYFSFCYVRGYVKYPHQKLIITNTRLVIRNARIQLCHLIYFHSQLMNTNTMLKIINSGNTTNPFFWKKAYHYSPSPYRHCTFNIRTMTFGVLRAKMLRIQVFWDVTLCSRVRWFLTFWLFHPRRQFTLENKGNTNTFHTQQPLTQWHTSHPTKPEFSIHGFWVICHTMNKTVTFIVHNNVL